VKRLVIVGTGGHARVVTDAARLMNTWDEIVFVDDRSKEQIPLWAAPLVGTIDDVAAGRVEADGVVLAVGANAARARLGERLPAEHFASIVHPRSVVARDALIGGGSMILAGAVVAPGVRLGMHVIVNHGANIDHDCELGDVVHVSPNAALGGSVRVGARTWVGIGAAVINDVTLGEDVVVGAGAAVIRDVLSGATVGGVPARRLMP